MFCALVCICLYVWIYIYIRGPVHIRSGRPRQSALHVRTYRKAQTLHSYHWLSSQAVQLSREAEYEHRQSYFSITMYLPRIMHKSNLMWCVKTQMLSVVILFAIVFVGIVNSDWCVRPSWCRSLHHMQWPATVPSLMLLGMKHLHIFTMEAEGQVEFTHSALY